MIDTEDVADHFPEYKDACKYWEELAGKMTTKSISDTLKAMLRSNSELNELTSIPLAGLRKSMNKLGKVKRNFLFKVLALFNLCLPDDFHLLY